MNTTDKKPSSEFFDPNEMQARIERLKAQAKLVPLKDLLKHFTRWRRSMA